MSHITSVLHRNLSTSLTSYWKSRGLLSVVKLSSLSLTLWMKRIFHIFHLKYMFFVIQPSLYKIQIENKANISRHKYPNSL